MKQKQVNQTRLSGSQKALLAQGALSSTFFAIGTGNFLAGYLLYLGAQPAFCAVVAALPQLGCIMQIVSPFLFERMRHRKALICGCCFAFRFGMGLAGLIPFLLTSQNARLGAVFAMYLLAFSCAGFVTPGLDQWTMELAPKFRRGQFFAWRNILSALLNSGISLVLGWQLDQFTLRGESAKGYFVLYVCCCLLACVDLFLLSRMAEIPCDPMPSMKLGDLLRPLRDKTYRKIMAFLLMWFFAVNFSRAFISVYMLEGLGMPHTTITIAATVASVAGMVGTWFWGKVADRSSWNRLMILAGCLVGASYLCWGMVKPGSHLAAAFVLQALLAACNGSFEIASMNLQFSCSPRSGKTLYLGVGAAVSNVAGYGAALLGASLQSWLMVPMGIRSINLLFVCSGIFCLTAVLAIVPKLPKVIPGQE